MGNVIGRGSKRFHSTLEILDLEKMNMGFTLVKKIAAPAGGGAGRKATEPMIAVGENGQVRMNSLASKLYAEYPFAAIQFDEDSRKCIFVGLKTPPKGWTEDEVLHLAVNKKTGQVQFGAGRTLASLGYQVRESGNQIFRATYHESKSGKWVVFELPKGTMPKRAVTPRKRKVSTIAPTPAATPAPPEVDEQDALAELAAEIA